MRGAGYVFVLDRKTGKESYMRRLGRDNYPRLHMYIKPEGEKLILDVHLDQKQPSYAGSAHMHNAEHDGPVVEGEIERLRDLVIGRAQPARNMQHEASERGDAIGNSNYDKDFKTTPKKGFFGRLFS